MYPCSSYTYFDENDKIAETETATNLQWKPGAPFLGYLFSNRYRADLRPTRYVSKHDSRGEGCTIQNNICKKNLPVYNCM